MDEVKDGLRWRGKEV